MKKFADLPVMFIIVNTDLPMGKGKVAAQCCHSACNATRILERNSKTDIVYKTWIKDGETKVVLRATGIEMIKILEEFEVDRIVKRETDSIWCTSTHDAGKTQIPAGSLTTITFRPMFRENTPDIIKKLKLLG